MHRRSVTCFCFAVVLAFFEGCGRTPESIAEVEEVGGVTLVRNPAVPRYPNKKVSLIEELAFGEEPESEENGLLNPVRFTVDREGNLFVAEAGEWCIKEFDDAGRFVRAIGKRGEGPGEFQHITALELLPDGRLLVMDVRSRLTSLFSRQGEFLESFPARTRHVFLFWTTDSSYLSDEYVWRSEQMTDRRVLVKEYDLIGEEIRSFGEFFMQKFHILRDGGVTVGTGIPHSPQSVFASDKMQKWLYHMKNDTYLIEIYDRNGVLFRKIERPYEPVLLTAREAEEFRSDPRDPRPLYQRMIREMPLPEYKAIAQLMCVDDRGFLWVQTSEEREEAGRRQTAYDVFDRDGYYDARVWMDDSLDLTGAVFSAGSLYVLAEEESGLRVVMRYQVRWDST